MGNICGKQDDPFAQPGRRVGTSPSSNAQGSSNNKTVPVPKKKVGGPGRTLGGSSQEASSASADDARRRAAEAAEARAKGSGKPAGKLQTQLNAQKKQNRSDTLKEASSQEQRSRDADEAAKTRNWD
ncbi:hypothetical protein NLU13_2113 [Sarocladium strictum]|uniref:Uncharacterized protein n=1 Tax=Sarocladium strictum TaxID=5046 RepID=A0AA39GS77_SARSR|nr:hypothetical protein NLU13_2113 [Sarocladium strictum]